MLHTDDCSGMLIRPIKLSVTKESLGNMLTSSISDTERRLWSLCTQEIRCVCAFITES